ncbi:hypothetical protein [Maritimibacter sp. UBA3975]|uniref:hypothetical protein n=1 Tax=Maritimibacter sp. UBA3975 TaxID=1946833 RepID=UPI000C0B42F1|nr:hypothetical protein [Maritimibacter sp. UBA3975]MAM60661.1 hypothetical protein [Maritimibacter sp.]|tara:strand:- start:19131 stop:20153 length:1023 start_codon:yes stop_codon:yes gene_type:complete
MTALKEYDRLEAPGLWRPDPAAQRVDVVVSIGDATLTVTDMADRALSHWSLAALHRINPGKRPALYAPSDAPSEDEQLELADDDMIAAIERIRKAIARRRPRSGRVRFVLTAAVTVGLVTAAVAWLPGALTRQTVTLLPDVTRTDVGERLLSRILRVTGPACDSAAGQAALTRLARRVMGPEAPRVVMVTGGVERATHLPGRIIVLNDALIESAEEPDAAAGALLAEALRIRRSDPMQDLLEHAGLVATVRMLTTGALSDPVLDAYAQDILTTAPAPLPDDALIAAFAEAGVRSTPYAYALDPTGESTLGLIEADPVAVDAAEPLIPDNAWISLQSMCSE